MSPRHPQSAGFRLAIRAPGNRAEMASGAYPPSEDTSGAEKPVCNEVQWHSGAIRPLF